MKLHSEPYHGTQMAKFRFVEVWLRGLHHWSLKFLHAFNYVGRLNLLHSFCDVVVHSSDRLSAQNAKQTSGSSEQNCCIVSPTWVASAVAAATAAAASALSRSQSQFFLTSSMALFSRLSACPNAFACPGSMSPCAMNAASRASTTAYAFAKFAKAFARCRSHPVGVGPGDRIVADVPVEVDPALEPDRGLAIKASHALVVVAGTIFVKAGLRIE